MFWIEGKSKSAVIHSDIFSAKYYKKSTKLVIAAMLHEANIKRLKY